MKMNENETKIQILIEMILISYPFEPLVAHRYYLSPSCSPIHKLLKLHSKYHCQPIRG